MSKIKYSLLIVLSAWASSATDWEPVYLFPSAIPICMYMLNTDVKRQRYLSEAWFTARLALCPNMAAFNVIIPPHSANTLSPLLLLFRMQIRSWPRRRASVRWRAKCTLKNSPPKGGGQRCGKTIPLDSIQFLAAGATIQESFRVWLRDADA